jgi:hypothetical protein
LAQGNPDNTLTWYMKTKDNIRLHPDTRELVEKLLGFVDEKPKGKPKNDEVLQEMEE